MARPRRPGKFGAHPTGLNAGKWAEV